MAGPATVGGVQRTAQTLRHDAAAPGRGARELGNWGVGRWAANRMNAFHNLRLEA